MPRVLEPGSDDGQRLGDSKVDTHRIDWQTPDGNAVHAHRAPSVNNGEAYVAKLPRAADHRPRQGAVAATTSGGRRPGNDFGCPPTGGHNLDIALPALADVPAGHDGDADLQVLVGDRVGLRLRLRARHRPTAGETYRRSRRRTATRRRQSQNPNANACQTQYGNGITGIERLVRRRDPAADRVLGDVPVDAVPRRRVRPLVAGRQGDAVLRFSYATDPGLARRGWFIDDVEVTAGDKVIYSSDFEQRRRPARLQRRLPRGPADRGRCARRAGSTSTSVDGDPGRPRVLPGDARPRGLRPRRPRRGRPRRPTGPTSSPACRSSTPTRPTATATSAPTTRRRRRRSTRKPAAGRRRAEPRRRRVQGRGGPQPVHRLAAPATSTTTRTRPRTTRVPARVRLPGVPRDADGRRHGRAERRAGRPQRRRGVHARARLRAVRLRLPEGQQRGGDAGRDRQRRGAGSKACAATSAYRRARLRRAKRGLRFDVSTRARQRFRADVFLVTSGRRIRGQRLVARFRGRRGAFTWNGRGQGARRARDGYYVVKVTTGSGEVRRFAARRVRGKWSVRPAFDRASRCAIVRQFRATRPVFGGRSGRPLDVSYRLSSRSRVTVWCCAASACCGRSPPARAARTGPTASASPRCASRAATCGSCCG